MLEAQSFPRSLAGEAGNSGFTPGKCSEDDTPPDLIIQLVVDRGVSKRGCTYHALIPGIESVQYTQSSNEKVWSPTSERYEAVRC